MPREANIVAIIQARMESERLPGKILLPLAGQPMILQMLDRLRLCEYVSRTVVATTDTRAAHEQLSPLLKRHGVAHMMPSVDPNHVLQRYLVTAHAFQADHIVRLTGDCPLIDPEVVDNAISTYFRYGVEYLALTSEWPDGLDVEVFSYRALQTAYVNAKLDSDKEHVTPYLWRNPGLISQVRLTCPLDLSEQRWCVDTEGDYKFVRAIYDDLYPGLQNTFVWRQVYGYLLENPDLEPEIERQHGKRERRNQAYLEQRAQETGQDASQLTWEQERDGKKPAAEAPKPLPKPQEPWEAPNSVDDLLRGMQE